MVKNADPAAPSCSFSLPGSADNEDEVKVIIAGARSPFKSTNCRYCRSQEDADEVKVESTQEEEAEKDDIRSETKHIDEHLDVYIFQHDVISDDINNASKEAGLNEIISPRVSNEEDIIDSTPRDTVSEDVPSTPLQDDTPPSNGDDPVMMPNVDIPYDHEDTLEEELAFYDETNEADDDFLDIDDLIEHCPKSNIISSMQSVIEMSRQYTAQIEKALKMWCPISCSPLPRQPGTNHTKGQVINAMSSELSAESSRCLDEMGEAFCTFSYRVDEGFDNAEERQRELVESIRADMEEPVEADAEETTFELPRRRQDLADLYLEHRQERGFEKHQSEMLLGDRIPPTIEEEEEEEEEEVKEMEDEEEEEEEEMEEEKEEDGDKVEKEETREEDQGNNQFETLLGDWIPPAIKEEQEEEEDDDDDDDEKKGEDEKEKDEEEGKEE